jgi:hypothetical protein
MADWGSVGAFVAWWVPACRAARRSEQAEMRLSLAGRIVGFLALLIQAFGLSLSSQSRARSKQASMATAELAPRKSAYTVLSTNASPF